MKMSTELDPDSGLLLERTGKLARERFAERADAYDREAVFPAEDFDDLFAAGLHAPCVPKKHGGLGLGPLGGDTFTLWMMTKELAKADLSLGRCWEGHANSLLLIDALGTDEQKARWFEGVVERGERWVAWSGEPRAAKPGERRYGTTVTELNGGWIVEGSKVFATSASGADWAILLVSTAGPGGARHSDGAAADELLMLACDLSDPTVKVDGSWWDPTGMRATVSHLVRFERTFLPRSRLLGPPGAYLRDAWQTAFVPHYAASFLGAAEAAYDYALTYLQSQDKGADPYVQQRVARMSINVETAHLWLRHVARLWDDGQWEEARVAGSRARHLIEHLAEETVHHCIRSCGARSLIRPSPVERVLRDLTFYLRHDNDDQILATVGKSLLGQHFDPAFHKP